MTENEIQIGGIYRAKVTNRVVDIRIDCKNPNGGWDATNLTTGKTIHIKAARRLLGTSQSQQAQPGLNEVPCPSCYGVGTEPTEDENTCPRCDGEGTVPPESENDEETVEDGSSAQPRKRRQILGNSACSVLKALGKVGIKYPEADAILKRHGIEMPKASVSVQLGFGRNEHTWQRHGQPAQLTEEQISELREG